jgi:hypothetical protein
MTAVQVVFRVARRACRVPTCDLDQHWLIKQFVGRPHGQNVAAGGFGPRVLLEVILRPFDHFMHVLDIGEVEVVSRPCSLLNREREVGLWRLLLPERDSVPPDWSGVAGVTLGRDEPHHQSMAGASRGQRERPRMTPDEGGVCRCQPR